MSSLVILNAGECSTYRCPGERREISRAVHLSRMAAFYPACRDCEHRHDAGSLSRQQVAKLDDLAKRRAPRDVFQRDGIRGVYLNEITRDWGIRVAEAVAGELWRDRPRRSRSDLEDDGSCSRMRRPTVVVANDGRAASWDVGTGIVLGLRRGGCDVIDTGILSGAAWDFAVHHLRADAGLWMTGAGGPASWCGVDIVDGRGVPWSLDGRLTGVREGLTQPVSRRTRSGGEWSHCHVLAARQAMGSRFLHGLTGPRVGLAGLEICGRTDFDTLLGPRIPSIVPVEIIPEKGEHGSSDPVRAMQRGWRRKLREHSLELGFTVSPDGRAGELIDELGRPIPAEQWFVRLADYWMSHEENRRIVVSAEVTGVCRGRLKAIGAEVVMAGESRESLVAKCLEVDAVLATDGQGRVWFQDDYPVCDPFVTLSALLRAFKETDQPVSRWAL